MKDAGGDGEDASSGEEEQEEDPEDAAGDAALHHRKNHRLDHRQCQVSGQEVLFYTSHVS